MKSLVLGIVAIFVTILSPSLSAESRFDRAEQHMADIIYSQYYPAILEQLRPLPLTRSVQEAKTIDLISGYADCTVSALKGIETLQTNELLNVLAERYEPKKIASFFSYMTNREVKALVESLEKPIRTCAKRVEFEIGLVRNASHEFVIFPLEAE